MENKKYILFLLFLFPLLFSCFYKIQFLFHSNTDLESSILEIEDRSYDFLLKLRNNYSLIVDSDSNLLKIISRKLNLDLNRNFDFYLISYDDKLILRCCNFDFLHTFLNNEERTNILLTKNNLQLLSILQSTNLSIAYDDSFYGIFPIENIRLPILEIYRKLREVNNLNFITKYSILRKYKDMFSINRNTYNIKLVNLDLEIIHTALPTAGMESRVKDFYFNINRIIRKHLRIKKYVYYVKELIDFLVECKLLKNKLNLKDDPLIINELVPNLRKLNTTGGKIITLGVHFNKIDRLKENVNLEFLGQIRKYSDGFFKCNILI